MRKTVYNEPDHIEVMEPQEGITVYNERIVYGELSAQRGHAHPLEEQEDVKERHD